MGGEKVIVKRRFIHPDHAPGVSHDIAMLELSSAVSHVSPAKLYEDDQELGKVITFIGAGGTGTGLDGQTISNYENNGVLRKANNQVELARGPLLEFVFDPVIMPFRWRELGAAVTVGASLYKGVEYIVLGVSSRGEFGSTPGKYGNRVYSRVSFLKTG